MLVDEHLERSNQWQIKLGPEIGGPDPFVPPVSFTSTPPTELTPYMEISITGVGYTDGMAALQRPWLPVFDAAVIPVTVKYSIVTDTDSPKKLQAIETDLRFCDTTGWNYNGSFQINYEEGGEIQVTAPNPTSWGNTGLTPGKYIPGVRYDVEIAYLLDTVTHTITFVSVKINGILYTIAKSAPAEKLGWTPGLYHQMQLDLVASGGSASIFLKDLRTEWN